MIQDYKVIKDKKELVKHVSFMIMGDGGVYRHNKNGNGDYHFMMNMKKSNEDYIQRCADVLSNITGIRITEPKISTADGYNRKPQLTLVSSTHPFFTKMRERIYVENYKSIDVHALNLLDYEAFSYLYMSDGSYSCRNAEKIPRGKSDEHRITLNMKRLSYGDQFILKKALKEKLDLEWNINRNGKYYVLRLRAKDVNKFIENITPYIVPSFQYKLKVEY